MSNHNLADDYFKHKELREKAWIANNIVINPTQPLASWTIQSIHALYRSYGEMIQEYKDIADRFELKLPMDAEPGQVVQVPTGSEDFVMRWYRGLNRLNAQIQVLDIEIARRDKLVGVMG